MTPEAAPAPQSHPALSRHVSLFTNAFAQEPCEQILVGHILDRIRAGVWGEHVARLRRMVELQNEKGYQDAKRQLPAFTMSGACLTRDAQVPFEAKFMGHSGILQCDFDRKDNPHLVLNEIIPTLQRDPHVLFGFISPSGVGLKAGVLIDGDKHAESFTSAEAYFLKKYALQIDRSTKDPLRLCFVSDDDNLWTNHGAVALPVDAAPAKPIPQVWHPPIESTAEDIREMLKFIPPRPDYSDWIRIASAVWSVLGLEDGCRLLAEWSPEEKPGEYADKHRHKLSQIGIGTLIHYAAANGFDAKAAARRKRWAGRIRFAQRADAHHPEIERDPSAEVRHVEISREFIFGCSEKSHFGDALLWTTLVRGQKLYDHLAQAWRTYRLGVWEKDDTEQTKIEASRQIAELYEGFAATIRQEMAAQPAPEGTKDPRQKLLSNIEARKRLVHSHGYLSSVLEFAQALLATKATEFDRKPHLLCVLNGVVDFEDGSFREHRPSDMLTTRSEVFFSPEATCPKWTAFLDYAMSSDGEMIAYLARAVGYSLTGYVDKDVLFFNYGKGANGKSTYTSILKLLMGHLMTTISIDALLARRSDNNFDYNKAMLEGKRIVVTDEIPESRLLNEANVKSLIGGDEITARRPYEKPYTFEPTHKLWLIGNHKPEIKGVDYGIWRRIHLIPWTNTIPEDKRRPRHEILAELRAELPGILNWAIRGYLNMVEGGGLQPPQQVVEATREYRRGSDQFAIFLEDRVERAPGERIAITDLLHAYLAWCQDNGEVPQYASSRKIIAYLKEQKWVILETHPRTRTLADARLLPCQQE